MFNFTDYSRYKPPQSRREHEKIHFSRFQIKTPGSGVSRLLVITGLGMGALALLAMLATPTGTTGFYLASIEMGFGMMIFVGTVIARYMNALKLQMLPLPKAKSVEEYLTMLDIDEDNRYGIMIPDLFVDPKKRSNKGLEEQTRKDFGRLVHLVNGEPIPLNEEDLEDIEEEKREKIVELSKNNPDYQKLSKELEFQGYTKEVRDTIKEAFINSLKRAVESDSRIFPLLNQSLLTDLMGKIQGRYQNSSLNLFFTQRGVNSEGHNTLINAIKKNGKWYIQIKQIFQIRKPAVGLRPLFILAELYIDVAKNSGYVSWKSPQTEVPSLI